MLTIQGLEKYYIDSQTQALKGVTFSLPKFGFINLRGNSGSGKSTLIKLICGFETFERGNIIIDHFNYMSESSRERSAYIKKKYWLFITRYVFY